MSGYKTTISLDRDGPHLLVQTFELRVEAGPARGLAYTSSSLDARIGTHRSNDFVLDDPTVSRFHC
jgi:two-component system, NtrC family, response regulator GlrR